MHLIFIILVIFSYSGMPVQQTLLANPGATLEQCKAAGVELKTELEKKAEVKDVEFKCVEVVEGNKS